MRPEIVVFVALLAVFLYWKFGTGTLPGLGGVGARVSGIFGSLSSADKNGGKRWEFGLLLALIVAFTATMYPEVFDLPWKHGWQLTTVVVVAVIAYAVMGLLTPPRTTGILKFALLVLVSLWVWESLPKENTWKVWWNTEEEPTRVRPVPQGDPTPHSVVRTIELYATPNRFTWVRIPGGAMLHGFDCPLGTSMAVIHRNNPRGRIYNCDEGAHIALGYSNINLWIGFQSNEAETVYVVMHVLVPKS